MTEKAHFRQMHQLEEEDDDVSIDDDCEDSMDDPSLFLACHLFNVRTTVS